MRMNANQRESGIEAIGAQKRRVDYQQIHAPLAQLGGEIFGLVDFTREIAAAIEQTAKEFANGEIAFQNQYGARANEAHWRDHRRRLDLFDDFDWIRLNRIDLEDLARHDQDRGAGWLGGFLEVGTPDPKESRAALAATERREK